MILQKANIKKICNNLIFKTSMSQLPATLIEILEFSTFFNNKDITNALQNLY